MCAIYVIVSTYIPKYDLPTYFTSHIATLLLHILYYSQECGQVSDEAHTRMRARDKINET